MSCTRNKRFLFFVLSLSLAAVTLSAHHYASLVFDDLKPVRLKGVLVRVEWMNPHVHFYLEVKGSDGRVVEWLCETSSPGSLSRRGLRTADLKVGTEVSVDGYRAKDNSPFVIMQTMTLADGRRFSAALADATAAK